MLNLERIKSRREEIGLTQTDFAKKVGISLSHYSMVEKGDAGVSVPTLEAILKVLNLCLVDVWIDDENTPPAQLPEALITDEGDKTRIKYTLPETLGAFPVQTVEVTLGRIEQRLQSVIEKWSDLDDATKDEVLKLINKDK